MRIGAPVFGYRPDAEGYAAKLKEKNYFAAYCPDYLVSSDQEREIEALKRQMESDDIVIAEVGAWCNPLSPDPAEAARAEAYIEDRLRLADALGARCCVNIIGAASTVMWYAPAAVNFSQAFIDSAVRLYSGILDRVQPTHTHLAFEVMPFCFLDDVDGYLDFMDRMGREEVAVHLDLVNLIHDLRTLYGYREIFKDAVDRLGARCVSAHIKDIDADPMPVNTKMDEKPMGTGYIDPGFMARCLEAIPGDLPVMLEHLPDEAAYDAATRCFTRVARENGIALKGGFV